MTFFAHGGISITTFVMYVHMINRTFKPQISSTFNFDRVSDGKMAYVLKCGFCKKLLLYQCNSDHLPTFFILSSLLGGFAVALLLHPLKSDNLKKKVDNWSELHSEKKYYL